MNSSPILRLRSPITDRTLPSLAARLAAPAFLLLLILLPSAALATAVTYSFESGSATLRGTVAGDSTSIFDPAGSVSVGLASATAVVDADAGPSGSLDSLTIVTDAFSANLDPALTGLSSITVSSATLESLGAASLSSFGQFAMQTSIMAEVSGTLAGGGSFGPTAVGSLANSGTTTGLIALSGDKVLLRVSGLTVASFAQLDPRMPNIEIKADFEFIGRAVPATPIPEPGAALVFGLGITLAGSVLRRRD